MIVAEPIKLRKRTGKNGVTSLYLEYSFNGSRSYEYLKLYLIPEKTRADKEKNQQTMMLADAVRSQRIIDYQNGRFGFKGPTSGGKIPFFEFFNSIREIKVKGGERNGANWTNAYRQFRLYDTQGVMCKDIDRKWIEGYKDFLMNQDLARNTRMIYFQTFKSALRQAYKEELTDNDLSLLVPGFPKESSRRVFLTMSEVRTLAATYYPIDVIKRAFLFSCLTGLRFSDIQKMIWDEVQRMGGYTRIVFRQKKTREQEYLDISPQAAELLGRRGRASELVFKGLKSDADANKQLRAWTESAGIEKHVTFHSGRHTFAVMMLDLGTDIYTVSKLLGHTNIATTQIYAKVLDKNKQMAMEKIPKIW